MPVIPNRETAWPLRVYSHFSVDWSGDRYTREMTDSLLPPGHDLRSAAVPDALTGAGPWLGLTDDDATRINAALTAAYAETTRTVYAFAWRRWACWCTGRGIMSFPAEPAAVCAYLTGCADQGLSLATIDGGARWALYEPDLVRNLEARDLGSQVILELVGGDRRRACGLRMPLDVRSTCRRARRSQPRRACRDVKRGLLQLHSRYVLTAGNDDVLRAVENLDVFVPVHDPEVPGVEPATRESLRGCVPGS
jgi:hypothetical protein